MRSFKVFGSAVVAVLILASSAQAANWDPAGVVRHGHGTLTLTSGSATVHCTVTVNVKSSAAVATTTDAAGNPAGPSFSNCSNNLGVTPTVVTTPGGAWVATATSTTAVDVTGNALINIGNDFCTIQATDVTVPNNPWSNATHTLSASSATAFDLDRTGTCLGTATTGTMSGSVVFPSDVIIT